MKQIFKVLGLLLLFLLSIMSVNALEQNSSLKMWYKLADNATDFSGFGFDGTLFNSPTFNGSAVDFDGVDQYIRSPLPIVSGHFTVSTGVNVDSFDNSKFFGLFNNSRIECTVLSATTNIRCNIQGTTQTLLSTGALSTNTWYFITQTFDDTANNHSLYLNGIRVDSASHTGTVGSLTLSNVVGASGTPDAWFNGQMRNFTFFNRSLTGSEVLDLFNNGITPAPSTTPLLTYDNINLINDSFFNTTLVNVALNISQVNSNTNINTSYFINNGSTTVTAQIGTNTQNVTGVINFSLGDAQYKVWFRSENNETNVTSENFTITIDTINPVLNISGNLSSRTYTINWSNFINFSDVNVDTCTIDTDESTTNCANSSYTWINNGNHTFNVTLNDSAGNTINSINNIFFVNPNQFFRFNFTNGTQITDFTFAGRSFVDVATIPLYDFGIGNQTFLFDKFGLGETNISVNFNLTSAINLTTVIELATIQIFIFDRETEALINITTTTVTLVATVGANGTTSTGLINFSSLNFISEAYQIIASNDFYNTESVFFNFNNEELLTVNIFMLNSTSPDAGTINLIVKDSNSLFIQRALCSALEWRPAQSAFISVAQGITNINGQIILNIEIGTKIYKFSCTKSGVTVTTDQQIVQTDGSTLTIILTEGELLPSTFLPNIAFSFTNSTFNATHQLLNYTFVDSDGLVNRACIRLFRQAGNNETFINETCVSTSSGSIVILVDINNSFTLTGKATVSTGTITDFVLKKLTFVGLQDIQFQLQRYHLDIFIPTILIFLALALGILSSNISLGIILMPIFSFAGAIFVPSILSATITIFILVLSGLMLWGGFNRK